MKKLLMLLLLRIMCFISFLLGIVRMSEPNIFRFVLIWICTFHIFWVCLQFYIYTWTNLPFVWICLCNLNAFCHVPIVWYSKSKNYANEFEKKKKNISIAYKLQLFCVLSWSGFVFSIELIDERLFHTGIFDNFVWSDYFGSFFVIYSLLQRQ